MKTYFFLVIPLIVSCVFSKSTEGVAGSDKSLKLPSRIVILRHAEDRHKDSYDDLQAQGLQRADALAASYPGWSVLTGDAPLALFATSFHTVETLKPTARKAGMPLIIMGKKAKLAEWIADGDRHRAKGDSIGKYYPDGNDKLIHEKGGDRVDELIEALKDPAYRGKTVVVCWVHEEITALVSRLGYDSVPDWQNNRHHHKSDVYDRFWVLDLVHDKKLPSGRYEFDESVNITPQHMLPSADD
jgi:hypothetical protein